MINRVVLVGRMTKDPIYRKSTSGVAVANFTLACNRVFGSKNGNQPEADFIPCVVFNRAADITSQYTRKGSLVGVEGRIQTRSYEAQDGRKVYVTEVVCDSIQLLEPKSSSENRQSFQPQSNNNYFDNSNQGGNNSKSDYDLSDSISFDLSSDDLPF